MAELPLTAPFGEQYQYSNQMVAVGGYAAAVADGGSPDDLGHAYEIALRERVLNPIGMPRTTLALADVVAGDDYATPHAADMAGALHPLPLLEDDIWMVRWRRRARSGRAPGRWPATSRPSWAAASPRTGCASSRPRTWSGPGSRGWRCRSAPGTPPVTAGLAEHYGLGWVVGAYGGQRADLAQRRHPRLHLPGHLPAGGGPRRGGADERRRRARPARSPTPSTFRLLELLFDQPATFDAVLAPGLAAAAAGAGRAPGPARPGRPGGGDAVPGALRQSRPGRGRRWRCGTASCVFDAGGFRSELRPLVGDDGTVAATCSSIRRWAASRRS